MKNEMTKPAKRPPRLFDRVASILEDARASVVRTVNTRMVIAYWLIGREIVHEEQGGKRRASYGDALLEDLSQRLTERYGRGYSVANLRNFRQFHLCFPERLTPIHHPTGGELTETALGVYVPSGKDVRQFARQCLANSQSGMTSAHVGFAPQLSWSHYSLLMRVENMHARSFYEIQAIQERWTVADLERQINSLLFERLTRLKCYVLIDLKMGKLSQQDLGQMQLYVNYYDREVCAPDDNPTVGLILCTDRNESMVRYTLPKGQKQIFAARYRTALPSEAELVKLLRRDWDMVVREQRAIYGK